jgi:hypothetical protein
MTIFGFEIRRRRSFNLVVKGEQMTEAQLNDALAVAETHPYHRAILQLIDTARENATLEAGESIATPTLLAGYVGGGRHLILLRDDVLERRKLGLEARLRKQG